MSAAAAYFRDGRLLSMACFSEIPSIDERAVRDGVGTLYRTMVRRGELFQAGRRVNDPGRLAPALPDPMGSRPEVIVCDRYRVNELRDILERERFPRAELVIRGMGWKDGSADVRGFRAAVLSDRVIPERSVLMASAISKAQDHGRSSRKFQIVEVDVQGGRNAKSRDDAAAAGLLAVSEGNRRWHVRRAGVSRRRRYRTAIA